MKLNPEALTALYEALVMIRDADNDCRADGNPTIPPMARAKIDEAIQVAEQKPLSAHAWAALASIAETPVPTCSVNPGVADKLSKQGLIDFGMRPSPFPTHKGKETLHALITTAGRKKLKERP